MAKSTKLGIYVLKPNKLKNLVRKEFEKINVKFHMELSPFYEGRQIKEEYIRDGKIKYCFNIDSRVYDICFFYNFNKNVFEIGSLEVTPKYRRRGYGTKLVKSVEHITRKIGCKRVDVLSPLDKYFWQNFWKPLGYRLKRENGIKTL